jgi:bifunctional N-acetylglucosamine-1-phosphate-uridyltransferase/glucosamine-1-phosphate-acetyltransferase GlmU-like protein
MLLNTSQTTGVVFGLNTDEGLAEASKIIQDYTGRFIMFSGITKIYDRKTVANATVPKHTDVHIPARRKPRPFPL